MPSTLSGCAAMTSRKVSVAASRSRAAPVALQRRVEHRAEPVQDHRLGGLAQEVAVDLQVVLGAVRRGGEGAGGHQDGLRAGLLDEGELLLVGGADLGQGGAGR